MVTRDACGMKVPAANVSGQSLPIKYASPAGGLKKVTEVNRSRHGRTTLYLNQKGFEIETKSPTGTFNLKQLKHHNIHVTTKSFGYELHRLMSGVLSVFPVYGLQATDDTV